MADVFKALADATRRTILDELSERNDQTLFEICSRLANKHRLASSRQAISQHLDLLENAGLIETRREGRCKLHRLNTTPLEHIFDRWLKPDTEERR
jgi:DNA-binding transcriptional ArsR family regulator